jgi:imidazolonepropionase-like amidohydrolase
LEKHAGVFLERRRVARPRTLPAVFDPLAREIVFRVREGGQPAMDAIVAATSLNASALGLSDRIGALAPGMDAYLIADAGDPLTDITALQRVVFVMRGGRVYKNVAPVR